jgi:Rieske Fe-S protein
VTWRDEEEIYVCPCHDGLFDISGEVVGGPPPRPLDQYENKVEDGVLFIRLEEA